MVACDSCDEWYHFTCIGLRRGTRLPACASILCLSFCSLNCSEQDIGADDPFECDACKKRSADSKHVPSKVLLDAFTSD